MKKLAVDFGERRVGVAISDAAGRVALPLVTILRESDSQVISELAAIVDEESVDALVVGEPRRLDGSRGEAARRAASFAAKLSRRTGLPHVLVDESLTSREAERRLRETGRNPRRHTERIDALAAQIILEDALRNDIQDG